MSDLDRLDEALATQEDVESAVLMLAGYDYLVDGIDRVYAAARAYRDLLANGERAEWCEEHEVTRFPESGVQCWYSVYDPDEVGDPGDCRMVERVLIDPTTEEER